LADVLVRREAFQGLEPSSVIVSSNEVGEVALELVVTIVVIAFDCRFLDSSVHALDLTIGPRMLDLGQPMFDAVLSAAHIEHMRHESRRRSIGVARREGELNAVIGEHRVDFVGNSRDQGIRKAEADVLPVFLTNCTKANFEVRSMAT